MAIEILRSPQQSLITILRRELNRASMFRLATAYLTESGIAEFIQPMEEILIGNGVVTVMHGCDGALTEPDAIKSLANLSTRYLNMRYLITWPSQSPKFHPKMYITADERSQYTTVIGSSNATLSGLQENVEVNVVFKGTKSDPLISNCLTTFDSLTESVSTIEPTGEWIYIYEKFFHRLKETRQQTDDINEEWSQLYEQFRQYNQRSIENQYDCIALAIHEITDVQSGGGGATVQNIQERAKKIAHAAGLDYQWDTWNNSIRSRLNSNIIEKHSSRQWFERVHHGVYKLSPKGLQHVESLRR